MSERYNEGAEGWLAVRGEYHPDKPCLTVLLIQCSFLVLELNQEKYFLSGTSVLCLNETDSVAFLASSSLCIRCLQFTPEFISRSLHFSTLHSPDFPRLIKAYHYPALSVFRDSSSLYAGVLPVSPALYATLNGNLDRIAASLGDYVDIKWSCHCRSELFVLLHILERLRKKLESSGSDADGLSDIVDYLMLNIHQKITIPQICQAFHTNRTTLTRLFREKTGRTPIQYLLAKRIEYSKYELAFTQLSLLEIAHKYAFTDAAHYIRTFKAYALMTPLKYRQSAKARRIEGRVLPLPCDSENTGMR